MNKFTEQFNSAAKNARLTDAERLRVHTALRTAMEISAPIPSPFFTTSFFLSRAMVAAALILVIGGGTAYAAEGALPGDALYPIKVSVNEPVSGALAFSDEAKANWHADIAEARLREAEALADKGELTASTSDELAANFNEHAGALAKITSDLGDEGSQNITSRFSSIVAHRGAAILAAGKRSKNIIALRASGDFVVNVTGRESDGENTKGEDGRVMTAAAPTLMKASHKSAEGTSEPEDTSFAQSLSVRAHAALSSATSTIAAANLSGSDESKAEKNISKVENLIVKGDAELSIGNVSNATDDFNEALRALVSFDAEIQNGNSFKDNPSANSQDDLQEEIHSSLNEHGPSVPSLSN